MAVTVLNPRLTGGNISPLLANVAFEYPAHCRITLLPLPEGINYPIVDAEGNTILHLQTTLV